jgi:adenine-specific DNA-methyltransferase
LDSKKYQSEFHGTNLLKKLIGKTKFSYPKSIFTVLDTIKIMSKPGDVVVDFFGGSGTTAHAVFEANKDQEKKRKFILIEQLQDHIDVGIKRLVKVQENIEESFLFTELKQSNQQWVKEIQAAKDSKTLAAIWERMKEKAFISYQVDVQAIDEHAENFAQLSLQDQQRFLIEVLDKNQLYVNYSEMDDEDYWVSEEDKKLTKAFYELKGK